MSERRSGLQKSVNAIFAGALMPEEVRLACADNEQQVPTATEVEPPQAAPTRHRTRLEAEEPSEELVEAACP